MTKPKKKKTQSKWVVKSLELQCVGIQYRLTISTRRFVKERVESKPLRVEFKREPENSHDENAIAVWTTDDPKNPYRKMKLGYIPRETAKVLAPVVDLGEAEFGISLVKGLDVEAGTADLQVKLRVKRGLKVSA